MTLSDEELTLYAIEEAKLLAHYVGTGARNPENTINQLISVLDRTDIVEAVDRFTDANCVRVK